MDWRSVAMGTGLLGALVALGGCTSAAPTSPAMSQPSTDSVPEVVVIAGTVRSVTDVNDRLLDLPSVGSDCREGDEPSVVTGAQVLLLDSSGDLIGEGEIASPGIVGADPDIGINMYCQFSFEVNTTADKLDGDLFTLRFGSGGHEEVLNRGDLESGPDFQVGQYLWH